MTANRDSGVIDSITKVRSSQQEWQPSLLTSPRSHVTGHSNETADSEPYPTSRLDARHQPASVWVRKQDSPLESTLPDRRFSRQPQSHLSILLSLRGRVLRHPNMRHRHVIEGVTRPRTYSENRGSIFAHPSSLPTPNRCCFKPAGTQESAVSTVTVSPRPQPLSLVSHTHTRTPRRHVPDDRLYDPNGRERPRHGQLPARRHGELPRRLVAGGRSDLSVSSVCLSIVSWLVRQDGDDDFPLAV